MRQIWSSFLFLIFVFQPNASSPQDIDAELSNRLVETGEINDHGLQFSWFGAASIVIDDGQNSVLIDPFVSRSENGPIDVFLGRNAVVEKSRVSKRCKMPNVARASAILVGHTHYDHVLDVAEFGGCTKAQVFGSAGASRVVSAHGYEGITIVKPGQTISEDQTNSAFRIEILNGTHGRPPLIIDPLDKKVRADFSTPASIKAYGRGAVLNFLVSHPKGTILHIGSAGMPRDSLKSLKGKVDVLFLALVGRPETQRFLATVVGDVQPKHVVPIHFDNLFDPIDEPVRVVSVSRLNDFFSVVSRDHPNVNAGVALIDEGWHLEGGKIARVGD